MTCVYHSEKSSSFFTVTPVSDILSLQMLFRG
jgi:hypothetical protein